MRLLLVTPVLFSLAIPAAVAEHSLKRPIALTLSEDSSRLYVANRSGSLSIVDTQAEQVVDEVAFGRQLSDLQRHHESTLLICDEGAHRLLIVDVSEAQPRLRQQLDVSPYPVQVRVSEDQSFCVVASLWSRRLTFISLTAPGGKARAIGTMDLPFAPRCLHFVRNDTRLIVGDAFGGQLGVVDPAARTLLHMRELPGHNIRGIDTDPTGKMLVVAHQMLNELAHTVRNDVHWGLLMSNDLRWLLLDAVLSPAADLYDQAHMHPLGHAGSATGDPSGLDVAADGTVLVALGGVNEIAVGKEDEFSLLRLPVKRGPTAVAIRDDSRRGYVANTFDDSISVVDLTEQEVSNHIRLAPPAELSLAERGEVLFFNARLSHDSWMSCHSCHPNGHTNNLMSDNFSDASFGAPKRVLSLLSVSQTEPFAWNGSAARLQDQIRKSIENTMQSDAPAREADLDALAAFLRTLTPPPSLDRARGTSDPAAIRRGTELFAELQCDGCHTPPRYTSSDSYDVGLEDQLGHREFNPPSLLGLSQRGPYFHDNRAASLEQVFAEFQHQLDDPLAAEELQALIAFLRSL